MKKEKYSIEFVLGNASQRSLWRMLTDPTLMEEWFAERVEKRDKRFYTFKWDENNVEVEQTIEKPFDQIRYNWLDEEREDTYFEFKIHTLELSSEIALEVIAFAEADEKDDAIFLWETQIELLKRKLGI
ncbi:MAG TPA: START-like domain-containing protein [Dysgonamonadaceae bacterium]|nr:START-like domain-containing protein [Dysgonamonadaceae bacterium]